MKMKLLVSVALGAALVAGSAMAADSGEALLQAKGCLMCHNMAGQKVGPGFKETAAKYAGKADAKAMLAAKLKEGKIHPQVSIKDDAEINAAVAAALAVK